MCRKLSDYAYQWNSNFRQAECNDTLPFIFLSPSMPYQKRRNNKRFKKMYMKSM